MTGWTYHGGRIEAAVRAFGGAREAWLDLSTGINPNGWPGADSVSIDWRALPDEGALIVLEAAAAEMFGVDPRFVCALPGSEIGLRLLGDILPGEAAHVAPSYRTHAEIVAGSHAIAVEEIPARIAAGRTVILANPNNPDGRLIAPADLPEGPGWLVVDEAFADSRPEASIAASVGTGARRIVFRSFGKFFGLAGARLGFVIAPPAILAGFRQRLGSWPISAAALAIGTAAYRDTDWIAATRRALPGQAAALDAVLARHGLIARGECLLFRLVETEDAAALFERLARQAILTRPFDYAPRWLRIGLPGDAAGLDRLDRALG
ncbi:pyridoxal phosphate-dependent class II aminotransferase [Sphingomonas naphthae]|uniref:Aminotransferase n=1 Tax=Sphingomonas naphthae TaxID=1813468 RepID=A0ABY7THT7_9SPHN|nr:threonine-phosphate decarboxylase [Sphingomonas naphthae]WCT72356.1 pyridoxal phosphate-dependent class II aminotransferase [Sphingomonas naphthae]